jgi:hypothetical protein
VPAQCGPHQFSAANGGCNGEQRPRRLRRVVKARHHPAHAEAAAGPVAENLAAPLLLLRLLALLHQNLQRCI